MPLAIHRGLRRLEFIPVASGQNRRGPASTHVIVEFVAAARLAEDQLVSVHLGIRNGVERVLEGFPSLLKMSAPHDAQEFLYRLEGNVDS